jgi:YjbE family integral membrane protein
MNGDVTVPLLLAALKIIWINLLLSGDNAVLIALACRQLPGRQRRLGTWLGAAGAVALRVVFAFIILRIMAVPFLKTMGGLMLIGVAIKIIVDESGHTDVVAKENLWGAVASIVMADALMSLDNVIAIAAASEGSMALTIFGLALSVPIVVFGAGLVMLTLERFPFLVWAGAALLGWIAVDLIAEDPLWAKQAWFTFDMLGSALSRAA